MSTINRQNEDTLLRIRRLSIGFKTTDGDVQAVREVDVDVGASETVAVVGESGSGKSQTMLAVMGLLPDNATVAGSISLRGDELLGLTDKMHNRYRGQQLAMIFQEPMTSLDPLYTIGFQIAEPLVHRHRMSSQAVKRRVLELFELVRLPDPSRMWSSYPQQLSGGQRQRAMIAMALANRPDVLIADEPTTALDVTVQSEILALLADLQRQFGMSIIFVTHDLGIARHFADRVYVMEKGKVVETGTTQSVFATPRAKYTKMLLAAEPTGTKSPPPSSAPVLLESRSLNVSFFSKKGFFLSAVHEVKAVQNVDFTLRAGQTIGVVGESGSGKSTLGRAVLRLLHYQGSVLYQGQDIKTFDRNHMRALRRHMQVVFQDPFGSLSPRLTMRDILLEGLRVHEPKLSSKQRACSIDEAVEAVRLDRAALNCYPHEFSGGQRQRIAVARAIILKPKLLILDEPTSALDRFIQKGLIDLLRQIQADNGLSYIFISHDLAVVRAMADEMMVMKEGLVVERGATDAVFDHPQEDYTRALIAAALDPGSAARDGDVVTRER